MNNDNVGRFIVYLCPVGELNTQIETYFACSRELCGENTAHKYMPHCTLTGFFEDRVDSIPAYLQALSQAYKNAKDNGLDLSVEVNKLTFNDRWHGIEIEALPIKTAIANFTRLENSLTRSEDLRLKDWLHLSLAYGFTPQHQEKLQTLALETIDLHSRVNWELRFYQQYPDWSWQCHQSWQLSSN